MKDADFIKLLAESPPLDELPKHYNGPVIRMKHVRFEQCSIRNANSYLVLGHDQTSTFLVTPFNNYGCVVETEDLKSSRHSAIPQMKLALRDTPFGSLKQPFCMRVREDCSRQYYVRTWCDLYVSKFAGLVSDRKEPEQEFWQGLINNSSTEPSVAVWTADWDSGQVVEEVAADTPSEEQWGPGGVVAGRTLVFARRSVIAAGW